MKKPPSTQEPVSRRAFLKSTSTAVVGGAALHALPIEGLAGPREGSVGGAAQYYSASQISGSETELVGHRLLTGWEYRRGNLGGVWEVWRKANDDANAWTAVELPHCFNAFDAVDPDGPYYQGPGWYRTKLKIENPFPAGRTLLHFEGAGQKSEVYVYTGRVGEHVGGYDEFTVDITDAADTALKNANNKGLVPVAVLCDNSRDLEMIPSNLSDFNLYGGLYRYLNLVYVPAIALERVHVVSKLTSEGQSTATIHARLHNPGAFTQKWEKPAKLILEQIGRSGETVTVQVRAQDRNGIPCLDARNVVRFGLTGDGRLVDNLGTSTSARKVELYNGRAVITLQRKGEIVASVTSEGLPTAFLLLDLGKEIYGDIRLMLRV